MKKTKILIVEKEAIEAWDILAALKKLGYDRAVAYSGKEAIEKAEEIKPDLVLMDIVLIGNTNVEEAIKPTEEIHKQLNIPIVYTSTYPKPLREIKPKSYILEKPFEEKDLLNIIKKALQK